MQKMDTNSQPLGICQRLIRFMLSVLRSSDVHHESVEFPIEEGSSRNGKSSFMPIDDPNEYSGSEIVVEFRHTDVSERLIRVEGIGGSIRALKKDGQIFGNEQTILRKRLEKNEKVSDHFAPRIDQSPHKKDGVQIQQKTGTIAQENKLQELEILNGTEARWKSLTKSVPVKKSVEDAERFNIKKINLPDDEATTQNQLRPLRPLLKVYSNIDEKSNEFIRTTKEAMTRNYNLDNNES